MPSRRQTLSYLRGLFARRGIAPQHRYGQNFLIDLNIHELIVKTANVGPDDVVIEVHPAPGGSGLELCSGDMLLEALVACAGVTLKAVATALDIPLRAGTVSAEGDLDFRGTLGVAKDAPVGFVQIRLRFDLDTDAPQDKLDQLLKLTERYCVVYQTIRSGPPVEISLKRK